MAFAPIQDHAGVHEKLHNGRVKRQQSFSGCITLIDALRNAFEFFDLVIFLIEGLHHTDAPDIFLNNVVQRVIGAEHPVKKRPDLADDQKQQ